MTPHEQPKAGEREFVERQDASVLGRETSVRCGLEILGLLCGDRRWLPIGEIASQLGLSPHEAHVHVSALCDMQLMRKGPGRLYGLGSAPVDLDMAAVRAAGIARRARAHLMNLRQSKGCPVTLAMLDGTELLVVDHSVAGEKGQVEMTIDLAPRRPAYATALGKVLLAYLPEQREQEYVEAIVPRALTARTITGKRELLKHLQEVRERGFAAEDREYLIHRRGIAGPVRGAHRQVLAAVGIAFADGDDPFEHLVDRHRASLLSATHKLSASLRHAQID